MNAVQAAPSTAPSFTTQPLIRQLPGGGVAFEVSLVAHPDPSIEWYKGPEAISNGGRYSVVTQTDGTNYVVVMEMSDVTQEDGGLYKVTARNSAGDASASFNLSLQGIYDDNFDCSIQIMIVDFDWKGYSKAYDDRDVLAANNDDDLFNVNDDDKDD